MTQQETPDPLGFLLSDPTPRPTAEIYSAGHPDPAPSAAPVGAFPTRRDLRRQREAAVRSPEPPRSTPAVARRRPERRRIDAVRRRTTRQRITGTATMLVVGGIFASLTLPAYAFSGATRSAPVAEDTSTQSLSVAADTAPAVVRDAYSATSASDLRALYSNATRQKNSQSYLRSTARALGDDYPYYDQLTDSQGGELSPMRYYYRECTDFVAWRLNRDAGSTSAPFKWNWSTLTPGGGNASQWRSAWQSRGWATGNQPQAGAVAWFTGNHVAYVNSVLPDGSVMLEEYNWGGDHHFGQRIVSASQVPLFLYAPPK